MAMVAVVAATPALAEKPASFCFNEWPPYAQLKDGEVSGISIEIIRAAAKKTGRDVEFFGMPWKRCLKMVEEGHINAVIDAAKRDAYLQGATSFSIYADTFWVHEDSDIQKVDDLEKRRIGLINGYEYTPELTQRIERLEMNVDLAVDDPTNIRMLAFKRLDAIIGDSVGTLYFARTHGLKLRPLLPPFNVDPLFVSFNRDQTALQRDFENAFKDLLADGTVDTVYRKYVGLGFYDLTAGN